MNKEDAVKKQAYFVLALALMVTLAGCTGDAVSYGPGRQPEQAVPVTHTEPASDAEVESSVASGVHRAQDPMPRSQTVQVPEAVASKDQLAPKTFDDEDAIAEIVAPAARPRVLARQQAAGVKKEKRDLSGGALSGLNSIRLPGEPLNRENYAHFDDNPLKRVSEHPVSTFSIDVDTGAYSNTRRMLNAGSLPVRDAVRVEEFVNYFSYDYPAPATRAQPFSIVTELGPNPWNNQTQLLHVGLKGYEVPKSQIPASNLVFLIDVSGSMRSADKIGLLKTSLKMLTRELRADDSISIVVYAGASGVVLEPTSGRNKGRIISALDALTAGGSTNGAAGIRLAYAMAEQAFVEGGINRVLLATDGDFNVGTTNFEALENLVEEKRKTGISLTTLGFGTGNYNDRLMEQLADAGNGNYAYIDTVNEARKVLVEQVSATLQTIAKDVKIQIEFNPDVVAEYRLVGYENRVLAREDFNNDKVDAGEIGAGHTVTAIYEIALAGSRGQRVETLRYQQQPAHGDGKLNEVAFLRLRYKAPEGEVSKLIERPIYRKDIRRELGETSDNFRFSAAVAGFGQLLRGGKYMEQFDYDDVRRLAGSARGEDRFGYRGEFVSLLSLAQSLSGERTARVMRRD
jgi:Ca-activated chloride channel family protein